jgi:probable FeS assembly SUF system protein SufT
MSSGIEQTTVTLTRDVAATEIPSGTALLLPKDFSVTIMQTLGGHVTVVTNQGQMARISDDELDALGEEAASAVRAAAAKEQEEAGDATGAAGRDAVMDAMRQVYDPEIPVNVVDLGLVYVCELNETDDNRVDVEIRLTMTAPGCGMGDVIKRDCEIVVQRVPGVRNVHADVVWEPPWSRDMMSEAAKLQLGMF